MKVPRPELNKCKERDDLRQSVVSFLFGALDETGWTFCFPGLIQDLTQRKMDAIIYFPEFEQLKIEVEKLRTELSMLVLERDQLLFVECKNIEMLYMLKLGALEYKAYETQCAMLRLKRKLELLQAKRNRQEKIDIAQIEAALDGEFAEYQQKLEEQLGKMNEAIDRSHAKTLTEQETKELKRLYRRVVKALHPDLNPNLSEEKRQLFLRAVSAYECGDLSTLRIIDETAGDPALPEGTQDAIGPLRQERDRLKRLLADVKAEIAKIKSEYPYTVKEVVQDEKKAEECRGQLEGLLKQYQESIAYYKAKIQQIVG